MINRQYVDDYIKNRYPTYQTQVSITPICMEYEQLKTYTQNKPHIFFGSVAPQTNSYSRWAIDHQRLQSIFVINQQTNDIVARLVHELAQPDSVGQNICTGYIVIFQTETLPISQ